MHASLLVLHVVGATLALLLGVVALASAKGRPLHRRSGRLFVYAMVAMCASAVVLAAARAQPMNVIAGLLTAYLVVTAFTTVRPSTHARRLDAALMVGAFVLGGTSLVLGLRAMAAPSGTLFGLPPFPFFMFGVAGLVGAGGDLRVLKTGPRRGTARLTRHLWRMCLALWVATASFFSIRSRVIAVFPDALVTPLTQWLPVLAVTLATIYWLWRVGRRPPRTAAGTSPRLS